MPLSQDNEILIYDPPCNRLLGCLALEPFIPTFLIIFAPLIDNP